MVQINQYDTNIVLADHCRQYRQQHQS